MRDRQSSSFTAINAAGNDPRTLLPPGGRVARPATQVVDPPISTSPANERLFLPRLQSGRSHRGELPSVVRVISLSQRPTCDEIGQHTQPPPSDRQRSETSRSASTAIPRLGWPPGEVPMWHVSSDRSGRYTATPSNHPQRTVQPASMASASPTRSSAAHSDENMSMGSERRLSSDSTQSDTSNRVAPTPLHIRVASATTSSREPSMAETAQSHRHHPVQYTPTSIAHIVRPSPPSSSSQSSGLSPMALTGAPSAPAPSSFRHPSMMRYDNWSLTVPCQYPHPAQTIPPGHVMGWPDMAFHNLPSMPLPFGESSSPAIYHNAGSWVHQPMASTYSTGPPASMSWTTASTSLSASAQGMRYQSSQSVSYPPPPSQPVPIPNANARPCPPITTTSSSPNPPKISNVNTIISHSSCSDSEHDTFFGSIFRNPRTQRKAYTSLRNPQATTHLRSLAVQPTQVLVLFTPLIQLPLHSNAQSANPFERLGRQISGRVSHLDHQYYDPRDKWPCKEQHARLCKLAAGIILVICGIGWLGKSTREVQERFAKKIIEIIGCGGGGIPLILVRIAKEGVGGPIKGFSVEIVSEQYSEGEMDSIARLIFRE